MRFLTPVLALLLLLGVLLMLGCSSAGTRQHTEAMRFVTVGTPDAPVRLAYRDRGKGKTLLLIHGFGANAYTWRHLEPLLARDYRVISFDLKGFGQSDKPEDKRYSVFDQAELVDQLIDELNLRDVTLVGHSFGGGIALVLALDEDETRRKRIRKMVLIDSVGYAQNIPIAFNLLRMPVVGPLSNALIPPEVKARAALRLAYHDNDKFDHNDVAEYAQPLRDKGSQHALIYSARQILPENIRELSRRYPTIKTPTLIVWCNRDKVVPLRIGRRLHADLPNSTFRLLRECGHMPHEEKPEETAAIIREFLLAR